MNIFIDIDGVVRNTIGKLELVYDKYLIETQLEEIDSSIDSESGDTSFEYKMILPVTSSDLKNHFLFPNNEEYLNFMYNEFPMEIFGHAGTPETKTIDYLHDIYYNFRDDNKIALICDGVGKSKPATLFFLSKYGCLIENIIFTNSKTLDDILSDVDILVSANPELLINKENYIKIKYNTDYNTNIEVEYSVNSLNDVSDCINKIIKKI